MDNTKLFAKFWLIVHGMSALGMLIGGLYASYSQHSTSEYDWALTLYLVSAVLVFTTLALVGSNGELRIHLRWAKIKYWVLYISIAMAFVGIRATNVVDYSIPDPSETDKVRVWLHYVFTGLGALLATFLCWHYYLFNTKSRNWAIFACIIGMAGFGMSLLTTYFDWDVYIFGQKMTISLGEFIISLAMSFVVWPIINEQLE